MFQEENKLKELIQKEASKLIELKVGFTREKLTDTPTDSLQVVNRKFVTNNGITFPPSPVTGQQFFSSVTSRPNWYNGTNWVSGTGSVVG